MLLALLSPALAGLLINEVVYDPASSDDGLEWIELCNNGSSTIDLTGYIIENAGSSYGDVYTFSGGSLAPGAYLIVGYGSSSHSGSFDPNLQNGGSESDGLRIKNGSGSVIDTLLYDDNNANGLAEDDGTVPADGAPSATSGKSLGRWPDCADTDVSATDFIVYASADITPGVANTAPDTGGGDDTGTPPGDADCTGSAGVKVNELLYTTDEEYIELYNAGSSTVNLEGWELAFGTSQSSTTEVTLPAVTLAPGAFWVVGSPGASYKDWEATLTNMGNASNTDGVLLNCNGSRVDTALYADDNSGSGWTDDTGAVATSFGPKPGSGKSVARVEDGLDTDVCGVDFVEDAPSPGLSNTAPPIGDGDCTGAESVKINELVYTTDAEWIELYNAGASAVTLDAWELQFGTKESSLKTAVIPDGTTLGPGEWIVIGSAGAATKDVELDVDMGNAADADGLLLVCNYTVYDTVIYGSPNDGDEPWSDDSGEIATSLAPKHGTDESIARVQDGYDTDLCGTDFAVSATPTPGAANPYSEPPVCEPASGLTVKLNEFIFDPDGTDTGNEWVELTNTGDTAVRLDAWTIETAGTEWEVGFTFPAGAELAPGDYLLVGGAYVGGDYTTDELSLDNASSGAGGLRIVDCAGTVIDSVLYGGTLEDAITGDGGSVETVMDAPAEASLGRYPNGEDTDAPEDWNKYADPTPGAANSDPNEDPCEEQGCGSTCNQGGPPAAPGGGCATSFPLGGLEVGLAALALMRRRRR
jgi:hypothetical protein